MRVRQGGTQMYCSSCERVTVCKAFSPSSLGYRSGQRWFHAKHPDIQWFRRGRECLECFHRFATAEVDENFLDELVELRDALKDVKSNAEEYAKQSGAAAKSLDQLNKSLKVLRALKIYKSQ